VRKSLVFIAVVLTLTFSACDISNEDNNITNDPVPAFVDSTFWFADIYSELITRLNGGISSEGYPDVTDAGGFDAKQVVNRKYVCDKINAKKGTNLQPDVAARAADSRYLLAMIDNANNNSTSYRTGIYAANQVVDTVTVNTTLDRITLFEPKAWTVPGSYQVELPPGTYRLTVVSGKGGDGGFVQSGYSANSGGSGALGIKTAQTFTTSSPITITVVVGSAGSRGGNGSSNKGHGGGRRRRRSINRNYRKRLDYV
jgi:hypothetical protein